MLAPKLCLLFHSEVCLTDTTLSFYLPHVSVVKRSITVVSGQFCRRPGGGVTAESRSTGLVLLPSVFELPVSRSSSRISNPLLITTTTDNPRRSRPTFSPLHFLCGWREGERWLIMRLENRRLAHEHCGACDGWR